MKIQKLTRVVSTKITEEEYNELHKLPRHYKLLGHIAKENTSEILRCIIKVYIAFVDKYKIINKSN